ncbi:MAG: 1-deoxy-D-xylulose-5-phosphate synthase [Acetobacter sp.]|nr:1-deoxy-D-xylulose-5-phosphate synthase [Acetobacter sp.]
MAYLDRVNSPDDVKKMSVAELKGLADEVRAAILKRDGLIGGHVGPNLGMTDAIIAMHYVFNSPSDKIVFDVSHQCYAHKIITGRKNGFLNPEDYDKITGYTNPAESAHDFFTVGHTSTSLSLASGLAKARDLKDEKHNVIAVIGDGSLSGGEALEGLNFAGSELKSNFIVVVNDNQMSIAENHGGLYHNLQLLRETNGAAELNLFKAMGYDYLYVNDGNDLETLIKAFESVKDSTKPVVVHLNTTKGKGYKLAEENKEPWHWSVPFDVESGEKKFDFGAGETYNDITYNLLSDKIKQGEKVVILNAGTPGVFGLTPEKRLALGVHYVDAGIAEEHCVAMSSALAKAGCKPVFCVNSSFVQRTYDQLSQDLALNKNPAVILVFWGGISGADATHLGCFDMAMMSSIPNLVCLAPVNKEEYEAALNWGLTQNEHPVVIRVPNVAVISGDIPLKEIKVNSFQTVQDGEKVAVLALGNFMALGKEVVAALNAKGLKPTLINPRFYSGVDEVLLERLKSNHQVVVCLEDGVLDGGFGEKVARFYGASDIKVLAYGGRKEFTDREPIESIYERNRLTVPQIVEDVLNVLK